jgi:ribosomal protein L37AE/L43A
MNRLSNAEAQICRPDRCPFCHSKDIDTLAKQITSASYWRCRACGEVWNVARLELTKSAR